MEPGEELEDNLWPEVGEVIWFAAGVGVLVRPDPPAVSGIVSEDLSVALPEVSCLPC